MNFEKILKLNAAKIESTQLAINKPQASSINQYSDLMAKRKQMKEEILLTENSENEQSNYPYIKEPSQRVLVHHSNEPHNKQESQLTAQQRKVVGDISRLFNNQPSKPTKLLIRLNQTQSNKASQNGSLVQSRLEKIEVTRLNQQKQANILDIFKHPTAVTFHEGPHSKTPDEQQSHSLSDSIRIQVRPQKIRQRLITSKQISIMFVPQLNISTLLGMKNPPQIFSKFNKKIGDRGILDSNASKCSQKFTEKSQQNHDSMVFAKLLDVDLFMKRKEMQSHRIQELRVANQKMLSSHLIEKENIQKCRQQLKTKEQFFTYKIQELTKEIQKLKAANNQLTQTLEAKQKSLANSKKLNEHYAKQNNELKAKIQGHLKTIHILKVDLANKQIQRQAEKTNNVDQQIQVGDRRTLIPKLQFQSQRNANEVKKYVSAQSPRRQITFNDINQAPAVKNQFYDVNPYYNCEMNQRMQLHYARLQKQKQPVESRIMTYRSQEKVFAPVQNQNEINNRVQLLTSRSQRVIIKKNTPHQQQILPSTKNLVRVNKNIAKDGSILLGDKLRDNKSSSSISNLSGKSLSQRIGFISKPVQVEKSKGMLVDYMIDEPIPQKMEMPKRERFMLRGKLQ